MWKLSSSEEAGEQQHLHQVAHHAAGIAFGGIEQQVGVAIQGLLGDAGDLTCAVGDHQGPYREGVEHADDQHREIGRPGDGARWLAGLVTKHRRGLEADETGERE
nr:hypothetical protein [Salinicola tamaricis]